MLTSMNILRSLLKTTVLALLFGCSAVDPSAPSSNMGEPQVTTKRPDVLREYRAFYIAPVTTYDIEADQLQRVQDDEVEQLAEEFRVILIRKLGDRYTAFPQPAKDVAVVHIALADVSSNFAMAQLRPGLLVPNAARGGATIEAVFTDSITKEVLATVRDTRSGARQGYFSGLGKWDGAKRAFEEWARLLMRTIEG